MTETWRVLLVDDEPADRVLAMRVLQAEFSEMIFTSASTEDELHHALARGGFDLVITDYQLNWATGLAVLGEVERRFADVPVIMFTASGNEEIAVEAMKQGLADYVLKAPRQYIRLTASVHNILERRRDRRTLREAASIARSLYADAPVPLFRISARGAVVEANRALVRVLEYERVDAVRELPAQSIWPSLPQLQSLLEEAAAQGVVRDVPMMLRRADGSLLSATLDVRARLGGGGRVAFLDVAMIHPREPDVRLPRMPAGSRSGGPIPV